MILSVEEFYESLKFVSTLDYNFCDGIFDAGWVVDTRVNILPYTYTDLKS